MNKLTEYVNKKSAEVKQSFLSIKGKTKYRLGYKIAAFIGKHLVPTKEEVIAGVKEKVKKETKVKFLSPPLLDSFVVLPRNRGKIKIH